MKHTRYSRMRFAVCAFVSCAALFFAVACATAPSPAPAAAPAAPETASSVEPVEVEIAAVPAVVQQLAPEPAVPEPQFREETFWLTSSIRIASSTGAVTGRTEYSYSDDGRLLSEIEYKGENSLIKKTVYSVQDESTVILEQTDGAGKILSRTVRELDGPLVKKDTVSLPNGTVKTVEEFEWDDEGRKTLWKVTAQSGDFVSTEYLYDDGVLLRMLVKDAFGNTVKRFERKLADGIPVREEEFDRSNRLTGAVNFVYDGVLPVREDRVSPSGALLSSMTYAYDENGNRTAITYLDRRGRELETRRIDWKAFTRLVPVEGADILTGDTYK